MSRLFTRIKMSRIISSLTDEQKQCIKTLLDGSKTLTLDWAQKYFDEQLVKEDTIQKYLVDGSFDVTQIAVMATEKLICGDKMFQQLHGAFLLLPFTENELVSKEDILSALNVCIVWTKPNKKNNCYVFNCDDCKLYKIDIKDSTDREHVYVA
eukprot:97648_1